MLMKLAIKVQNQFQSLKDLEIETRVHKWWKIIKQNQKHEPSTRSNLNHKYLKRAQKIIPQYHHRHPEKLKRNAHTIIKLNSHTNNENN